MSQCFLAAVWFQKFAIQGATHQALVTYTAPEKEDFVCPSVKQTASYWVQALLTPQPSFVAIPSPDHILTTKWFFNSNKHSYRPTPWRAMPTLRAKSKEQTLPSHFAHNMSLEAFDEWLYECSPYSWRLGDNQS